jgi:hypothetical protein
MRAPANVTVLLWQVSHGAVVGMCFGGLAIAVTPLWHETQLPMIPLWFMRAPAKVTVLLWQVSHGALVMRCLTGLPGALTPLWQVAHPLVMPA